MTSSAEKAATGVSGLDDVLQGGLSRGHVFLLEGEPGTGKTTIALQFLLEGSKAGEKSLYITLSETEAELRAGAASHGCAIGRLDATYKFILVTHQADGDESRAAACCC